MVDYIDRTRLLTALTRIKEVTTEERASAVLGQMIDTVAGIPAAEVRPCAKGQWQKKRDFGYIRCSECGNLYPYADYVLDWHYCPNCGVLIN